jgi:hypothetical protein
MGQRRTIEPANRSWLEQELTFWQQAGLITHPQAAGILSQYESAGESAVQRRNWFLLALWGCAAVLFGAAAFLLVSFNWAALPAAAKLGIIFGVLGGTYALALFLWQRLHWQRTAEAIFFLGALFYGAAIWLVAQVFHLDAHYPDGFFMWAIGVLPLALLLDSLLLHTLLVALLTTWISTEVLGFGHLPALLFGHRWNGIPNGAYLGLLMMLPGLWWCYRRQSPWGIALYVPLLAWWTMLQPIAWQWFDETPYFVGAVGAAFLIAAESHPRGNRLAIPFRFYGALMLAGALIPLSYFAFNQSMQSWHPWREDSHWSSLGAAIVISVWAGLALALCEGLRFHFAERGNQQAANTLDDIRRRQWVPLALAALMAILALLCTIGGFEGLVLITILSNVAMVSISLWLISVGLRDDRGIPFAGGVTYFLLWVILRYIDLFGNAGGMLGAAGLFFVCGLGLAGVAWFWHQRKQVLHVE